MVFRRTITSVALGAMLFSPHATQAADAVYLGDCNRAYVVQQQSTINTLLPHGAYEGIGKNYNNAGTSVTCKTEQFQNYRLKLRSSSPGAIVYDVTRVDINFDRKPGCSALTVNSTGVSGTVTFTTKLDQKGDLCELYIWSDWKQSLEGDATWSGNFANRVVSMDGGSFTIAQPPSVDGKYSTPISFTGVNP